MNTSQITDSCVTLIRVALFTVLLAQSQSAMGDGFRLSPLKLYFDANSNTASLKIQNDSASKVNLQLEAVTWSQDKDGEDLYSPTREIIFFPKILTIEAHGEQIVRVGYQGAPAQSKEKSYRLFVQELPVEKPGEARMAFAVRMSIPVFVRPVENDRAWHMEPVGFADQGLGIRVINTGNRYLMVGAMQAIGRDENGEPNGILADQAMSLVASLTPPVTTEDFRRAIRADVAGLSAAGITAIKDPAIDQRHWDAYKALEEVGDLTVRVATLWRVPDTMAEARTLLDHIAPMTNPADQDGDSLVVSAGVKIYIDGSGTARTAWMHDDWNIDYTDTDEGNTGLTYLSTDVLYDQIRLFHDAGMHIGSHAIGDRAIDFTMDAYERVLDDNPTGGLRHSIIHSNLPTEHALDLMAKLQRDYDAGYPEVQPAFLWWIGDIYVANFGPERSLRVLPLRTFEERGIKWAGASDYDVSPYAPRHAFWAAATRQTMLGTWGESPWGTDESVSIHDTLRAYTATAARQLFLEDYVGTIDVGKRADIVAWDRDLYSIAVDDLKDVKAVLTLMNGRVVHRE